MKKTLLMTISFLMILGSSVSFTASARQSEDPAVLLRAAIEKEEVDGDLQGAIAVYKQIVDRHSGRAAVAAKAQLRIGICFEKLGNAEAVKAYEAVLNRFPKEADVVAEARGRLASLRRPEPAGLTVARLSGAFSMECHTLSPDGTKLVGIGFNEGQNVVVYDLATAKREFITSYDWGEKSCSTYTPIWSPDGKEVAYSALCWGNTGEMREENGSPELRIASLEGKSRIFFRNTDGGGIAPCDWLPGGGAVVAVKGRGNTSYSLVLISTQDGSCREICPLERVYSPRDIVMAEASRSADASPDGRLIAFSDGPGENGRDIYIVSQDGSSRTQLTDHPADDKEPRWSPDGRHIVFLSLRHGSWALWGVAVEDGKPNGEPRMLLDGMQNTRLGAWTDKGLLSKSMTLIEDLYIADIDPESHELRGKPRVVDYTPAGTNVSPAWSPDGKHLAFVSHSVDHPNEADVVVMPAEGGVPRKYRIPTDKFQSASFRDLRWRPDCSALGLSLFDSKGQYSFFHIDLTTGQWKTWPLEAPFSTIEWRKDGKAFMYVRRGEGQYGRSLRGLFEKDLESGEERQLMGPGDAPANTFVIFLKASRDYEKLATFSAGAILIVDPDTKEIQTIKWDKGRILFPAWSPDGNYFVSGGAVRTDDQSEERDYYIVSVEDGQVKPLNLKRFMNPRELLTGPPDWSLDGKKIAFSTRLWDMKTNLIQNVIPDR
jgi:Tol biopolymer transport system component